MFLSGKGPTENQINYLVHEPISLGRLSEGILMRLDTQFFNWNLGVRLMKKNMSHPHVTQTEKDTGGLLEKDLILTCEGRIVNSIEYTEREVSLYSVLGSEIVLLNRQAGKAETIFQPNFDGRILDEGKLEIYLKYVDIDRRLYFSYADHRGIRLNSFIEFPEMLVNFRLFTVGEFITDDLRFKIIPLVDFKLHSRSFRIGNIIIREGDMFNSDPVLNANLVIIPASEEGTISPPFQLRVADLQIPSPTPARAGTLQFYEKPSEEHIFIGYAYSVRKDASNRNVIAAICKSLNDFLSKRNRNPKYKIRGVNMPLLGTGAGGLEPEDVLKVYIDVLNSTLHDAPVIVSVPSPEVFKKLSQIYRHQCVKLIHEFQNDKPIPILRLEERLALKIRFSAYEVDFNGEVVALDLQNLKVNSNIGFIKEFTRLRSLGLNYTEIEKVDFLAAMPTLRHLSLRGTRIQNFSFLAFLTQLISVDLSQIKNLPFENVIPHITGIQRLGLAQLGLSDISFLRQLHELQTLDLAHNQIRDLSPLIGLEKLVSLSIPNNIIRDLDPLIFLQKLRYLDIFNNRIDHIEFRQLPDGLQYLRADQNPFSVDRDLILFEGENHLAAVKNFLLRKSETNKIVVKLPAKVLLMGNHASGKTSLLRYIIDGKLAKSVSSTHIIQIEKLHDSIDQGLPIAMFYDFGGQDYYHGIYRAFLTGGAINLILWNPKNNYNQKRIDSNERYTQDFRLDYWMGQKRYLESEKESSQIAPVLLIQTHADEQSKLGHQLDCQSHGILNEFIVCLSSKQQSLPGYALDVQKKSLKYLKSSIFALIRENQVERAEPKWYIDFLLYIIQQNATGDHKARKVKDLLPHYKREVPEIMDFLKDDLHQLFRQGLILYYRDEMPDLVWLNPVALVNYVHNQMLQPQLIAQYKGAVPTSVFKKDKDLVELLIKQKVIFLHEPSNEYIIPNFLELAQRQNNEFELYTFGLGDPLFTMKFKAFLPFGLINQIICFFGDLPEEKKFWRDRLIFTLDKKAKVLINIDFQLLEIRVYASFISGILRNTKEEIKKYLFYGILGLYWDLDLLKFDDYLAYLNGSLKIETFADEDPLLQKLLSTQNFYDNPACRPIDLFLSVNEIDFVSYNELCSNDGSVTINSYKRTIEGKFEENTKPIQVFQFQAFTPNTLNRRKNVAISYSKRDLELVDKFKDYLQPLYDDELINHPWYCTELIAGSDWDHEIQKKFDAADIIFFMISENLMATKYVLENEIKNAIDKYNSGAPIKIVPIILVPYRFQRKGEYDLGRFSALPYTLLPVTSFESEHEAWYSISESIRIMIEKDIDPGKPDALPTELKKVFKKVIDQNNGKSKKTKI